MIRCNNDQSPVDKLTSDWYEDPERFLIKEAMRCFVLSESETEKISVLKLLNQIRQPSIGNSNFMDYLYQCVINYQHEMSKSSRR